MQNKIISIVKRNMVPFCVFRVYFFFTYYITARVNRSALEQTIKLVLDEGQIGFTTITSDGDYNHSNQVIFTAIYASLYPNRNTDYFICCVNYSVRSLTHTYFNIIRTKALFIKQFFNFLRVYLSQQINRTNRRKMTLESFFVQSKTVEIERSRTKRKNLFAQGKQVTLLLPFHLSC